MKHNGKSGDNTVVDCNFPGGNIIIAGILIAAATRSVRRRLDAYVRRRGARCRGCRRRGGS